MTVAAASNNDAAMSQRALFVPEYLRRGAERREEQSIDEAAWLLDHLCGHLGLADLGGSDVLDFGCGVKFTQAFINREIPVGRYVGVDVNPDVIEFLRENVDDPRFDFYRLDVHNDLYNPAAPPLSADSPVPIDGQQFDVICLFSVFTHLAPHDYAAMLRLLRRFVKPTGRLFYTLFVNEVTEGGHGLIDDVVDRLMSNPEWLAENGEAVATYVVPEFVDMNPKDPLRWAVYSRA